MADGEGLVADAAGTPPSTAGTMTSGERSAASTAMSSAGSSATTWAVDSVPSAKVTVIVVGAGDHVAGGEDGAFLVDHDTAEPAAALPHPRPG